VGWKHLACDALTCITKQLAGSSRSTDCRAKLVRFEIFDVFFKLEVLGEEFRDTATLLTLQCLILEDTGDIRNTQSRPG